MNIKTKRGSLDNIVTYEHYCDTISDLNKIPLEYTTLGSVAVVLQGQNGGFEVYVANSNHEWISMGSGGGSGGGGLPPITEQDNNKVLQAKDGVPVWGEGGAGYTEEERDIVIFDDTIELIEDSGLSWYDGLHSEAVDITKPITIIYDGTTIVLPIAYADEYVVQYGASYDENSGTWDFSEYPVCIDAELFDDDKWRCQAIDAPIESVGEHTLIIKQGSETTVTSISDGFKEAVTMVTKEHPCGYTEEIVRKAVMKPTELGFYFVQDHDLYSSDRLGYYLFTLDPTKPLNVKIDDTLYILPITMKGSNKVTYGAIYYDEIYGDYDFSEYPISITFQQSDSDNAWYNATSIITNISGSLHTVELSQNYINATNITEGFNSAVNNTLTDENVINDYRILTTTNDKLNWRGEVGYDVYRLIHETVPETTSMFNVEDGSDVYPNTYIRFSNRIALHNPLSPLLVIFDDKKYFLRPSISSSVWGATLVYGAGYLDEVPNIDFSQYPIQIGGNLEGLIDLKTSGPPAYHTYAIYEVLEYVENVSNSFYSAINTIINILSDSPQIEGYADRDVTYKCVNPLTSLDIYLQPQKSIEVIFTSGSTPTILTVHPYSNNISIKWPEWFNPNSLDVNTIYDIIITDGEYAAVMTWPV